MKALIAALIGLLAFLPHPFYVSITEIDHNPTSNSLEITMKIFVDDLNDALETHFTEKIWLGDEQEHPQADEFLEKYLHNRVQLTVNESPVEFKWIGREVEEDVCWVYLEVPNVPDLTSLELTHRLLIEVFPGQSNIVHVRSGEQEKSMTLRKEKSKDRVEFATK